MSVNQPRPIKAISFDAGGTLLEPWPSVGQVYCDVAREFGIDSDPAQLTAAFGDAWRSRERFSYSREDWHAVVQLTFGRKITRELFGAIYERFTHPEVWRVYPDVEPALRKAREHGLKLAVISNWDERLGPLLQNLGLRSYFDHLLISIEVGSHKPEPAIFEHAAREMKLSPGEILHIGDSEREDVSGAQNAGFNAARIKRSEQGRDLLQIVSEWI
jgi:putative hydrolase of the HAD superfamily